MDDIGPILDAWPYDGESNIRKIVGLDGKPKLQVRLQLGIQQIELDGRPDGLRPEGMESLLDLYMERCRKAERAGERFVLTTQDCEALGEEGGAYYQRYVLLFQIGDYERTARDTERNMRLFAFVNEYAAEDDDRFALTQYWPYIIRMNRMALALREINEERFAQAVDLVREAIELIESLEPVPTPTFEYEKERSLSVLRQFEQELARREPVSERDRLRRELDEAVRVEDYERAARLRDRLQEL
jgi:tetratricopeptide (TPR) repeat protein